MSDVKRIQQIDRLIIPLDKGNVTRGIRSDEKFFSPIEEIYFSEIIQGADKGWKLHKEMTMRLMCIVGNIKISFKDSFERELNLKIGEDNQKLLIVPSNIWFKFEGLSERNILVNYSSIIHNNNEIIRK
jgi:dTDP-4-dehydrorhamnose 3,5-epimerase